MKKITVAVLSGGVSSERSISLKSGEQVLGALDRGKYEVRRYDPASDLGRIVSEKSEIDIALIVLHGPFGEDGTMQGFLDMLGIPYQGSGVLGSSIAMDKLMSKRLYRDAGLLTPLFCALEKGINCNASDVIDKVGLPFIIKPVHGGSSIGMRIVFHEKDFEKALEGAFKEDSLLLAEEYIQGREITGSVLGNESLELLPIVEIIPDNSYTFFDYKAKYTPGATQEICPALLDSDLAERAKECASVAHKILSCSGYSRTDMIVRNSDIFVLETNTIPGMTPVSLFPLAARTAGISFSQLLDRLIELGLSRKRK
ncbi:MAG: D-alanine--D-alanine ligase [Pseudomonadota bacterium]